MGDRPKDNIELALRYYRNVCIKKTSEPCFVDVSELGMAVEQLVAEKEDMHQRLYMIGCNVQGIKDTQTHIHQNVRLQLSAIEHCAFGYGDWLVKTDEPPKGK